jgi:hypothetical protein
MVELQEDGIGQSGLAAGEAASDCEGREGESARSFSLRSVVTPAASVVPATKSNQMKSRAGASPSKRHNDAPGTLRFEVTVPSS